METSNSTTVYNKLREIYGNSFKNILAYYSLKIPDEDEYTNDYYAEKALAGEKVDYFKKIRVKEIKPEAAVLAESLLSKEGFNDQKENDVQFYTEGYIDYGDYNVSSKRVQRKIEVLAQKITKSILKSKDEDKTI